MQASVWRWNEQGRTQTAFWPKVRTLALDYGEPIIRLAHIPGAFVPGVDKVLEKVGGLTAIFGADLNISALDGPNAFQPFDGMPAPVISKVGDGPVFFEGVETTLTVARNARGKEQILLERIDLCVIAFVAGKDPYFSYRREGEALIGAGFIEPMRFYVELEAHGPRPARRQVRRADGGKDMLIAQSANFLDTEPASFYAITPGDAPVMIKVTLTAIDEGYYETCLRFFYRVAARELRQYTSEPIRLYTETG